MNKRYLIVICLYIFKSAETAGHRTLLYGQALLLRHAHSNMVGQSILPRTLHCILISCWIWSDAVAEDEYSVLFDLFIYLYFL